MLSQRRGMNAYSGHKVTRGYVSFGNQRVGVVERREAQTPAAGEAATPRPAATPLREGNNSENGIERARALSNNNRPRVFPDGKDPWTSYVRDHQIALLMSLAAYEAQPLAGEV